MLFFILKTDDIINPRHLQNLKTLHSRLGSASVSYYRHNVAAGKPLPSRN